MSAFKHDAGQIPTSFTQASAASFQNHLSRCLASPAALLAVVQQGVLTRFGVSQS